MRGDSGCDGCRLIAGGSGVPVDGRKEAVSLDLINIWALGRPDIQDLSQPCVSTECTEVGEKRGKPALIVPARPRPLRLARSDESNTRRRPRMETAKQTHHEISGSVK